MSIDDMVIAKVKLVAPLCNTCGTALQEIASSLFCQGWRPGQRTLRAFRLSGEASPARDLSALQARHRTDTYSRPLPPEPVLNSRSQTSHLPFLLLECAHILHGTSARCPRGHAMTKRMG